jgi:hypothetical protein
VEVLSNTTSHHTREPPRGQAQKHSPCFLCRTARVTGGYGSLREPGSRFARTAAGTARAGRPRHDEEVTL